MAIEFSKTECNHQVGRRPDQEGELEGEKEEEEEEAGDLELVVRPGDCSAQWER